MIWPVDDLEKKNRFEQRTRKPKNRSRSSLCANQNIFNNYEQLNNLGEKSALSTGSSVCASTTYKSGLTKRVLFEFLVLFQDCLNRNFDFFV